MSGFGATPRRVRFFEPTIIELKRPIGDDDCFSPTTMPPPKKTRPGKLAEAARGPSRSVAIHLSDPFSASPEKKVTGYFYCKAMADRAKMESLSDDMKMSSLEEPSVPRLPLPSLPSGPSLKGKGISNEAAHLLKLPNGILEKILGYVFTRLENDTAVVRPFYQQGKLAGYIRACHDPIHDFSTLVTQENIDVLRPMATCKDFAKIGSEIFYGQHLFSFTDPDAFKWWIKHIGLKNLDAVRRISISVHPGFTCSMSVRSCFDLTAEEMWLQGLYWLRTRHNLDSLEVIVLATTVFGELVTPEMPDEEESLKYRTRLHHELLRYRNLKKATLLDYTGAWGEPEECHEGAQIMTEAAAKPDPDAVPKKKRMTLAQILEEAAINRQMREEMAKRIEEEEQAKQDAAAADMEAVREARFNDAKNSKERQPQLKRTTKFPLQPSTPTQTRTAAEADDFLKPAPPKPGKTYSKRKQQPGSAHDIFGP